MHTNLFYIYLIIIFICIPVLFFVLSRLKQKEYYRWKIIKHIPKWVKREAKEIQRKKNLESDTPVDIQYLDGTRFTYRLTFQNNFVEPLIERKPKRYNKKLHILENLS
jgi:hypothetical protein